MKNFVQSGVALSITATVAVKSGNIYADGALIGFAQTDAEVGELFGLVTDGVYDVDVASDTDVSVGDVIYFDGTALTTNSGADTNPRAGIAVSAGATADGVARANVKINA